MSETPEIGNNKSLGDSTGEGDHLWVGNGGVGGLSQGFMEIMGSVPNLSNG